jgi:hypothetical protein
MKKFILGLFLAVSVSQAAFFATNNLTAASHAITSRGVVVQSLTLYSTNTVPTLFYLFDGAITNVTAAFTNYTAYTTNEVDTIVSTTTGVTNLFTNTVIKYLATAVAAATNNTTPRVTIVVPASNVPVEYVFNPQESFAQYVTASNNLTGLSFIMRYRSP